MSTSDILFCFFLTPGSSHHQETGVSEKRSRSSCCEVNEVFPLNFLPVFSITIFPIFGVKKRESSEGEQGVGKCRLLGGYTPVRRIEKQVCIRQNDVRKKRSASHQSVCEAKAREWVNCFQSIGKRNVWFEDFAWTTFLFAFHPIKYSIRSSARCDFRILRISARTSDSGCICFECLFSRFFGKNFKIRSKMWFHTPNSGMSSRRRTDNIPLCVNSRR